MNNGSTPITAAAAVKMKKQQLKICNFIKEQMNRQK